MGPSDFLNHILNFVAPAAFVALVLLAAGRLLLPARPGRWWVLAAVDFGVGVVVLAGSLVLFGVDGKLLAYVALVVAMATSHWLMLRGWRR